VKDYTPITTPAATPPRYCQIEGNILFDEEVTLRRHDVFTGLRVSQPYRARICRGAPGIEHPPTVWLLDGDIWTRE
jgi:hypothetical protein